MHREVLCQHNCCPSSSFFSSCLSDCLSICLLSCLFPGPGGTFNRLGQGCTKQVCVGCVERVSSGGVLDALVGVVRSPGRLVSQLPGDLPGQCFALSADCRAGTGLTGWGFCCHLIVTVITAVAGGLVRGHGGLQVGRKDRIEVQLTKTPANRCVGRAL